MSAGFSALGFDPVPGDPDTVLLLSREARRVCAEIGSLSERLRRLGEVHALWQGTAAEEFAGLLARLPESLQATEQAFTLVGEQLGGWGVTLLEMQAAARRLEVEAQDARDRRAALWHTPPSRDPLLVPPVRPAPPADVVPVRFHVPDDAHARWLARTLAAQQECAAIQARARELQARALREGDRVAAAVRTATAYAPPPPGLFERIGDFFGELDRAAGNFVNNHAEQFRRLADACALLSVLALVPGVGAVPGLALGALALVSHSALARYADGSRTDVVLDLAGLGAGAGVVRAGRKAAEARALQTGTPVQPLPSMFSAPGSGPPEGRWRWVQMAFSTGGAGFASYGAAEVTVRRSRPAPPSSGDPQPRLKLVLPAPAGPSGPVPGWPTASGLPTSAVVTSEPGRRAEPRHLWPSATPGTPATSGAPFRQPASVGGP
ncbi:MAG: hypothetical protein JWN88_3029 [Frankiales bacterium]|jgi:hypothetical protein|nr:hypothetical protein [Frankiales bacterium]